MPPRRPPLDQDALAKLRELVRSVHETDARRTRLGDLIELADKVGDQAGITIDLDASRELGHPMVVVQVPAETAPASCLDCLSPRENQVVALIAEGLTNKQIAGRLFLALSTVKDHVHRILDKTGLGNRAAVASSYRGHAPPPLDGAGRPLDSPASD